MASRPQLEPPADLRGDQRIVWLSVRRDEFSAFCNDAMTRNVHRNRVESEKWPILSVIMASNPTGGRSDRISKLSTRQRY